MAIPAGKMVFGDLNHKAHATDRCALSHIDPDRFRMIAEKGKKGNWLKKAQGARVTDVSTSSHVCGVQQHRSRVPPQL
jgi:hypothetical protein